MIQKDKRRGRGQPTKEDDKEKSPEERLEGATSPEKIVPEIVDMKISEDELNQLIAYDEGKEKYVASCPIDGCDKVYESGTKGFPYQNLKKHLISHGIEIVKGGGVYTGGIFQRTNPIPAKVHELLRDYVGIEERIAKKIVELLDKNPVLTENANNLFNFLSRAKGIEGDVTLAKNIVDIVFSQAAYEQQKSAAGSGITPVFPQMQTQPQMGPGFQFNPMGPMGNQGGAGQGTQVAYVPNPGGGMTPVIINIPPQPQQQEQGNQGQGGQGRTQADLGRFRETSTADERNFKYLEDRMRTLERGDRADRYSPRRGEPERVTERVPMQKVREPIFDKDDDGKIKYDEEGKPVILDYRVIETPVFMGSQSQDQPSVEGKKDDPFELALKIFSEVKGMFGSTPKAEVVDEEKLLMKATEAARKETDVKVKAIEDEVKKVEEATRVIDKHIDDKMGEVKDIVKEITHETEKEKLAESAAKATYERLKPFISSPNTEAPTPPGLTPQQYAMTQVRQIADTMVSNLRSGFESLGQRLDRFADAQKITQMATSMIGSGIPVDQVERVIFQYVRGQMGPEAVEQAAAGPGSVGVGEKEAFLKKLRGSV